MPRELQPTAGDPIGVAELVDALAADPFDPRDEDALAARGSLLARLGRNRTFLAELAIAELKDRCAGQAARNNYGPQVFMLHPPDGRFVLRANFWPAAGDSVLRDSGPSAFFYDMPHDHNFSFLTVGYLGPGYWSDYYDYDGDAVVGMPGEDAGLRFVERSRLAEGRLLLYRAHRDVHAQRPPDSFSVSLNILAADPGQPWRSQYRFDLAEGTIAQALTVAPAEVLTTLAVGFGGGNGRDVADRLARAHPSPRLRATAYAALADADPTIWERAMDDPAPLVAAQAGRQLKAICSEVEQDRA